MSNYNSVILTLGMPRSLKIRKWCSSDAVDGSRNIPAWAEMEKEKFSFKARKFSWQDQSYLHFLLMWTDFHRSTSRLKHHLLTKHPAEAESPPPPRQRQTTLDSLQQRHRDNSTSNKLSTARAKGVKYSGQYLSLSWIVAIIINIHLHEVKTFIHSHVDNRIKNFKNIPLMLQ